MPDNIEQRHYLKGGLNLDDSPRTETPGLEGANLFSRGDYAFMLNLRSASTENGNLGAGETIRGTLKITDIYVWSGSAWVTGGSLPSGTNKCIGSYQDRRNNRIIYFVYNDAGNHGIYRFELNERKIYKIYEDPILNFQADKRINHAGMYGDHLVYTDGFNFNRHINIEEIYKDTFTVADFHINLLKPQPIPPLRLIITYDGNPEYYLDGGYYQFTYRYVYRDGMKSVWGPYSTFCSDAKHITSGGSTPYNTIEVYSSGHIKGLTAAEITANGGYDGFTHLDPRFYEFVEFIEMGVREGYTASWKLLSRIKVTSAIEDKLFEFRNDTRQLIIPTADIARPYDYIPDKSETLELVANRVMLGNNTEGLPHVDDFGIVVDSQYAKKIHVNADCFSEVPGDFPADVSELAVQNAQNPFSFKWRGVYQLGVIIGNESKKSLVYTDPKWRYSTVGGFNIQPGATDRGNIAFSFRFAPTFKPPVWGTWYQICRTECLNMSFFIEAWCNGATLMKEDPANPGEYISTLVHTEASFIYYDISNWDGSSFKVSTQDTGDNPHNNIFYVFQEGDRLSNNQFTNVEIIDVVNGNLIIGMPDPPVSVFDLQPSQIEVFRPRPVDETNLIFYEMGEEWYPIKDAGEAFRDWSKESWYYTGSNGGITKEIINGHTIYHGTPVMRGDVHNLRRTIYFTPTVEAPAVLPFEELGQFMNSDKREAGGFWERGNGKINIAYASNDRQIVKETQVRFSGRFFDDEDVGLNKINQFDFANQRTFPLESGPIRRLITASNTTVESLGNVLLAICENEWISIYVDRATVQDLSGRTIISVSDKVLGAFNNLLGSYGTKNPESVFKERGRVYAWDNDEGKWIRYSQDGLTPISDNKVSQFHSKISRFFADKYDTDEIPLVLGAVDKENNEVITYMNHSSLPATLQVNTLIDNYKCLAFSEKNTRWTQFFNYAPEEMNSVKDWVVGWQNGELYLHLAGDDDSFNNFYGTKYDAKVKLISNGQGEMQSVKEWKVIEYGALDKWSVEQFTGHLRSSGMTRQESNLLLAAFAEKYELFWSKIKNDKNTVNASSSDAALNQGDPLKGFYLETLLKLDPAVTKQTLLYFVSLGYQFQNKTIM